jgi:uncharacterized protein (DUF58 family)
VLPREGRYWLAVALAFLAIGLFKGVNLLALVGCLMLALTGCNALLAGRGLTGLRGGRRIEEPVLARVPTDVHVTLVNAGTAGLQGVRLEDGGPTEVSWFFAGLKAGEALRLCRQATWPRRGRHPLPALAASSGHPFGLVRRRVELVPAGEVVVLPPLGRLHRGRLRRFLAPSGFAPSQAAGHARHRHPSAQAEFHGVRTFRPGDSPRWIHWRTSARCGEPMVREFEDFPTDDLLLVVDLWTPPDQGAPAAVEEAVSFAATVCWDWCRQRGDRLVLAVAATEPVVIDGITGKDHAVRLLECLAVQHAESGQAGTALLDKLAGQRLPPAPALLVSVAGDSLAGPLSRLLNRPVAAMDVSALADVDFYERPDEHAR